MRLRLELILLLIIWPWPLSPFSGPSRWVVWNVGQGQWTTWASGANCLHLDAGGERLPGRALRTLCGARSNRLELSHWDWDHVSGVRWMPLWFPDLCRGPSPRGPVSPKRSLYFERLAPCSDSPAPAIREISLPGPKTSNGRSRVWILDEKILVPGDSTSQEERRWRSRLRGTGEIRWLLLGHHGSKTSTSPELLKSLGSVRQAIASARAKKYGHPHPDVVRRLRQARIALLKTEDWGHLIFEL